MDTLISLLVLGSLAQHAVAVTHAVTSYRAVLEIVSGNSRIFSGETVRLKCSYRDVYSSTWDYRWFKGSEQLPQSGNHLVLWNAHIRDSGKFYCQGVRDTVVGEILSLQSLPVEISVDGGWAIMQVPPHPKLEGNTLKITCRVRGKPPLHDTILYKDGVEVVRQSGPITDFYLTDLKIKDGGMYSCRASWNINSRTYSVISLSTPVQVLELLSKPVLEIDTNNDQVPETMMKLICNHEYNAPAPAPPIHYYFYRNNNKLGVATSENHELVNRTPGQYTCKTKVPELGLTRWSEPKKYE